MSKDQSPELNYTEYLKKDRKVKEVDLTFRKVCPYSSGTKKDQTTKKKGISIVTFFSNEDKKLIKKDIMHKIQDLHYGFVPTNNLHCTFLALSSKESFTESNDYFNDLINERIKIFIESKNQKNLKTILRFDEIRLGTWFKDHYPIPYASNGTIVAIGKPDTEGNKEFVKLADDLAKYLKINLYPVFEDKFERKFLTVWSTLGYLDHPDFFIKNDFACTFNKFKKEYSRTPLKIEVKKLRLVEYSFKDLRSGKTKILSEFKL